MIASDASTNRKAEERARDDLAKMMADVEIHDPIPCPQCFHYQKYMFSQVGYARYDGLIWIGELPMILGFFGFFGGIGYAAVWEGSSTVYAIAAVSAVVWFLGWFGMGYRARMAEQDNPNEERDVAERQHIARARAKRLED